MILQTLQNRPKPIFPNGPRYNFPYAGYVEDSSLNNVGYDGYYWSRTAGSDTGAYLLYFDSSAVNPVYSSHRFYGRSIRCVATT